MTQETIRNKNNTKRMLKICHRINSIEELQKIPTEYGIEFDVRDSNGHLIVTHDPFTNGPRFEDFITFVRHKFMAINIKSERIEEHIINILEKLNIDNYFLFDCNVPMIYKLSADGHKNIAIRYSEVECIDSAIYFAGKVNWVWVDCFTKFPMSVDDNLLLKKLGYKICIVGPDLHGRPNDILTYMNIIKDMEVDAICTKEYNLESWS